MRRWRIRYAGKKEQDGIQPRPRCSRRRRSSQSFFLASGIGREDRSSVDISLSRMVIASWAWRNEGIPGGSLLVAVPERGKTWVFWPYSRRAVNWRDLGATIASFGAHETDVQFHQSPATHSSEINLRKAKQYQEQNPIEVGLNDVHVNYTVKITNRCIIPCYGDDISSAKPIRLQDLGAKEYFSNITVVASRPFWRRICENELHWQCFSRESTTCLAICQNICVCDFHFTGC